ncbi:GIY-YIG nuclease family protein [candidate division CSSED10-310 bacterium]|uniref:GIY-YIG nuclease family protein n=1 Tax=candidate division CSSED10-310 bacterium TaxID=2855610 RepID=A0ABV6Z3J7_UNCC1
MYTGYTEDVDQRIGEHNRGSYHHTAPYMSEIQKIEHVEHPEFFNP